MTRDVIAGGVPTQSRSDDEKDHEEDGEDGEGYFEVESVEGIIPLFLLSDRVLPRLTTWTRGVITLESRYYGYSKTPDFGARKFHNFQELGSGGFTAVSEYNRVETCFSRFEYY